MKTKFLAQLAGVSVLYALAGVASAATVSLVADVATADPGDTINVSVVWSFEDATLGGGYDVMYDASLVSFQGISFEVCSGETGSGDCDPDFDNPGDDSVPGLIEGIASGDFGGINDATVAVLTFVALDGGGASRAAAMFTPGPTAASAGPFVDASTFEIQNPDFIGTSVEVTSAIPVPAALWLMIGGIGALLGFRRKA